MADDRVRPEYYNANGEHETVLCLEAHGLYGNGYRVQAAQYILRAGRKGSVTDEVRDLEKAIMWLRRDINRLLQGSYPGDKITTVGGWGDGEAS